MPGEDSGSPRFGESKPAPSSFGLGPPGSGGLSKPRLGTEDYGSRYSLDRHTPQEGLATATHLEGLIEADKKMARALQQEIDQMEDELRHLESLSEQIERETATEGRELDRQVAQVRDLDSKIEDARTDLAKHKDDRRQVNLAHISLQQDREHYQEELQYTEKVVAEAQRDVTQLQQTLQVLDKQYRQAQSRTEHLERNRKTVAGQVTDEKEALRREERELAEMKNSLQQMQRSQRSKQDQDMMDQHRDGIVREFQRPRQTELQHDTDYRGRQGHSWGAQLSGAKAEAPGPTGHSFAGLLSR